MHFASDMKCCLYILSKLLLVSILFLIKMNSSVNAISIQNKNAVSDRKLFFPISYVDGVEFMKTFLCSFLSYFVFFCFFFRYFWTWLGTVSGIIR